MDAVRTLMLQRRYHWWLGTGVCVALTVFGLTDVRRRARIDPARPTVHKTDLTIFTGAGAAFWADDRPYERVNPRGWEYAYPPLCALVLSPLALLAPQQQAVVWFALSCLMGWLAWREVARIGRNLDLDPRLSPENRTSGRWLGGLAATCVALPALNCLQRGQVGVLYLWLILWGYRLLVEAVTWRGALIAGIVLALPGVIKVTPALPAVVAVGMWCLAEWRKEPLSVRAPDRVGRSVGTASVAGLLLGGVLFLWIVPAALLGWEANQRHLRTWSASIASMAVQVDPKSNLETPYTLRNQSLSNAVYRFGNWFDHVALGGPDDRAIDAIPFNPAHRLRMDAAWVKPALLTARLALLVLLAAGAWRAARTGSVSDRTALFGLACVASLIVSPLSRGHYFVMLLPGVLWLPAVLLQRGEQHRRIALWLASVPVALTWAHYLFLPQAGRIGLLGWGIALWFVAGSVAIPRCSAGAKRQVDAEGTERQVDAERTEQSMRRAA